MECCSRLLLCQAFGYSCTVSRRLHTGSPVWLRHKCMIVWLLARQPRHRCSIRLLVKHVAHTLLHTWKRPQANYRTPMTPKVADTVPCRWQTSIWRAAISTGPNGGAILVSCGRIFVSISSLLFSRTTYSVSGSGDQVVYSALSRESRRPKARRFQEVCQWLQHQKPKQCGFTNGSAALMVEKFRA